MKNYRMTAIILALIMMLSLAACGSAQASAQGQETAPAGTEAQTAPAEPDAPADLCWLYGRYMDDYLHDVDVCQRFAVRNRERMLVELLRSAGTLPMDYYRELIGSYRRIAGELDMREVEDCLALYRRSDSLFDMMQREVL